MLDINELVQPIQYNANVTDLTTKPQELEKKYF